MYTYSLRHNALMSDTYEVKVSDILTIYFFQELVN